MKGICPGVTCLRGRSDLPVELSSYAKRLAKDRVSTER